MKSVVIYITVKVIKHVLCYSVGSVIASIVIGVKIQEAMSYTLLV